MSKLISSNRKKLSFLTAVAAMALLPAIAHATGTTGTTIAGVESVATTILGFLTGTLATLAGAIAIAFVGYRWFSGRMEMGKALATVAGIVLIIGSVQIVDFIRSGSNLTTAASVSSGS